MEKQELFDNYILGKLSPEQIVDFEKRMANDSDFATEYKLHLMTINGIRKEEEQDCFEFGHAMKSMTKEELKEIVGKKSGGKIKRLNFQRYLWPLSTAAVIIVAFTLTLNLERNARHSIDDMLYSYNEPMFSNRGGETIDISSSTDKELRSLLPTIVTLYEQSETIQETLVNGKGLAMIYIKLHDREKAKAVLQELIEKYKSEAEYVESVAECRKILNQIK